MGGSSRTTTRDPQEFGAGQEDRQAQGIELRVAVDAEGFPRHRRAEQVDAQVGDEVDEQSSAGSAFDAAEADEFVGGGWWSTTW